MGTPCDYTPIKPWFRPDCNHSFRRWLHHRHMSIQDRLQRVVLHLNSIDVPVATIAKETNVTAQAVYKWRDGNGGKIEPENLFKLADLSGFEARWIATGKGPELAADWDERTKNLIAMYRKLDERGRDHVFRVAQIESTYTVTPDGKTAASS